MPRLSLRTFSSGKLRSRTAACAAALALLACSAAVAALPAPEPKLESYLGALDGYDRSVTAPAAVAGFEPGEWHLRHHQVVDIFRELARTSNRLRLVDYGKTFSGRPLLAAVFASPERLAKLELTRLAHLKSIATGEGEAERPVVVWMSYGVHGNEPSATNSAAVFAYWLAASPDAEKLLQDAVVILDPCMNPDGFDRFANWANGNRGSQIVADPEHREHREPWPTGRFNHFLFDLNRDYLPLAQQESRARMQLYTSWSPDLLADWHEMGPSSTYFFQPGHPSRSHPLRPADADALTTRIAAFHAQALGAHGSLFYTRERFDDFYVGKASTYPDVTGAIGILFEQASSRGHVQTTPNGRLTFPFTIRNQVATSISTLRAAASLRNDLTARRHAFVAESLRQAKETGIEGWQFLSPEDPARAKLLADLLRAHGVEVQSAKGGTHWVPAAQPLYVFLQSIFEERTQFPDTTFYDISAWNAAHAYGVTLSVVKVGEAQALPKSNEPQRATEVPDGYAWLVDWRDHASGPLLQRLLAAGANVRVSLRPLRTAAAPDITWPAGTLVIPASLQRDPQAIRVLLATAKDVRIGAADSRMSLEGPDIGSDDLPVIQPKNIALVVGEGVDASDAGEVWFTLDQRIEAPVSLVEASRLGRTRLSAYTTLILANGTYRSFDEATVETLRRWIASGGTLIALEGAARWAVDQELAKAEFVPEAELPRFTSDTYGNSEEARATHRVAGAIFRANADLTHPLAFGLGRAQVSLFQQNSSVLRMPRDTRLVPLRHAQNPVIAGYVSEANRQRFSENAAIIGQRSGSGAIVLCTSNPVFRAYFHGTEKLLLNAIYFAPLLRASGEAVTVDDE